MTNTQDKITKKELVKIIEKIVEKEVEKKQENHIELSGIIVRSSTEPLKKIEQTANRLIRKHSDYLLNRTKLKTFGYAG